MVQSGSPQSLRAYTAVILAGGRSSRLGGVDKTQLVLDGLTLLERTLAAVSTAELTAVVTWPGSRDVPPDQGVVMVHDDEPFAGPAAALDSGLRAVAHAPLTTPPPWVVVLSADVPQARESVDALLTARDALPPGSSGVIGRDPEGHPQYLLACYRTDALNAAVAAAVLRGPLAHTSLRHLLGEMMPMLTPVDLPADLCADVDTPDDARRLGIPLSAPLVPVFPITSPTQEGAYAH